MKTYSHHNCGLVHRTYQDLAGCMFLLPWQEWPALGEGEYATWVYCRGLTVALHETLDKAQDALSLINSDTCGEDCRNDHHLVRLVNPSLARRARCYTAHNCGGTHTTYQELAGCMFLLPWQEWPALGEGEYATLVYCRGLAVALHETLDKAQDALSLIDSDACGKDCRNDHHLVRLVNSPHRRPIKTYRHHNCGRVHRTYRALAECMFRRQRPWWVSGQGEYSTLSYCRGLTVALWRTLAEAQDALSLIDGDACGGACRNNHALIRLVHPSLALRWPDRVSDPLDLLPLINRGPYTHTMAATRPQ
jgi:hypothetical protein